MYSTIAEALSAFSVAYPEKKSQVESALRHYFLPVLGFKATKTRANATALEESWKFMSEHSLFGWDKFKVLEAVEAEFNKQNLSQKQKKSPRSFIRQFLDFALVPQAKIEIPVEIASKNEINTQKSVTTLLFDKTSIQEEKKETRRANSPKITLSLKPEDYLETYKQLYPSLSEEELTIIIHTELVRIYKEVNDCAQFLSTKKPEPLNPQSINSWLKVIYQILGWSYDQTSNLSHVGLMQLIPVINTNIWDNNYTVELQRQAWMSAREVVNFLENFFKTYGQEAHVAKEDDLLQVNLVKTYNFNDDNCFVNKEYAKGSKAVFIRCLINVAKYLYKDITDKYGKKKYEDIVVIQHLQAFRNDLAKDNQAIEKLPLTYPQSKEILLKLKEKADTHITKCGVRRKEVAIAKDLQTFLAFCFLVVVPPIRRRSIAELRWGITLKYGKFGEDSCFTKHTDLKNGEKPKYYYHLQPKDYKTGKTYGEFIAPLPNAEFPGGTTFYDYLNKWLFEGWRERLQVHGQTHQSVFMQVLNGKDEDGHIVSKAGDPASEYSFGSWIAHLTYKYCACEVYPNKFRHIWRTHLIEIGASKAELESFAFFMQHSEEMAAKAYTVRDIHQKLKASQNFLDNMKF